MPTDSTRFDSEPRSEAEKPPDQPGHSEPAEGDSDLGFGSVIARESRRRLLNRDGSFNVAREGLRPFSSLSLYHFLLTVSWPRFLALVSLGYLVVNLIFAAAFVACGPGALAGRVEPGGKLLNAFFFSVQTFATIGYGSLIPTSLPANLLVTLESVVGLLGFALATGLVFARFSRPTARILFSDRAIIAPYGSGTGLMFRIANARSSQIIDLEAKVIMSRFESGIGRNFYTLDLERDRVAFFPLSWTIVHPIDERSPFFGIGPEDLTNCGMEILVLLQGIDEIFSQTVHARSSYEGEEVIWGAQFRNIFNPPGPDGVLTIDLGRLHDFEKVQWP